MDVQRGAGYKAEANPAVTEGGTRQPLFVLLLLSIFSSFCLLHVDEPTAGFEIEKSIKIIAWNGPAPDQYQILPHLLMGWLDAWIQNFYRSVLAFNVIFLWLFYLILFELLGSRMPLRQRYLLLSGVSLAYPLAMVWGWRWSTSFLLCLVSAIVLCVERSPLGYRSRAALLVLGIVLTGLTRADVALFTGVFVAAYHLRGPISRSLIVALPILEQAVLKYLIFPDARYYTAPVTIVANLSTIRVWISPVTWLLAALFVAFRREVSDLVGFLRREMPVLFWLFIGYFGLLMWVAMINEFRLYLFWIPFLVYAWNRHRPESAGGIADGARGAG